MTLQPSAIEIATGSNPKHSVIWLHGLGADGNDFAPIVPELGLPKSLSVRFIFPHAPQIPVTCNNGFVMRAWYDILYFDDIKRHADRKGIEASSQMIGQLITQENERGVPTENIVLAGFSQGGAMAYTVGLTYSERLAGIIALSTYLPLPELIAEQAHPSNAATPIFAAHGTQDPVVPASLGETARTVVSARGNPVTWKTWPMPHTVCLPEIQAIGEWLTGIFTG